MHYCTPKDDTILPLNVTISQEWIFQKVNLSLPYLHLDGKKRQIYHSVCTFGESSLQLDRIIDFSHCWLSIILKMVNYVKLS